MGRLGGVWVAYAVVIAIVVVAAFFDWRDRRHGRTERGSRAYWDAVSKARREARTRIFSRGRRFGP
jgi:hypothetical protein